MTFINERTQHNTIFHEALNKNMKGTYMNNYVMSMKTNKFSKQ